MSSVRRAWGYAARSAAAAGKARSVSPNRSVRMNKSRGGDCPVLDSLLICSSTATSSPASVQKISAPLP